MFCIHERQLADPGKVYGNAPASSVSHYPAKHIFLVLVETMNEALPLSVDGSEMNSSVESGTSID